MLSRRHLRRAVVLLRRTRLNADLLRYVANKGRAGVLHSRRSTRVAYPSNVMLELTNRCNLHCITCAREYAYAKSMDIGNMPLDKAKTIIDELHPYLDSIGLTGLGETLLYPHLAEIATYIKSRKPSIVISLSTNAQVPHFVERAAALLSCIDTLQVSIDGVYDVYETVRRGAKFATLDENLAQIVPLAQQHSVDVMLNMVLTRETYTQMSDVVRFAHDKGIRYVNFACFNLAAVTDTAAEYYALFHSGDFKRQLSDCLQTGKEYSEIEITGLDFFGQQSGFRTCPFPYSHFYVTWDGYTVPCCTKPFPKECNFGNAFDSGVLKALNTESYQAFRKMYQRDQAPAFCRKCHFIELDRGGAAIDDTNRIEQP